MNIYVRPEKEADYKFVEYLVEKAFENAEYSNHKEQLLVASLRKSEAFIPELSLVAELDEEIAGHILLTRMMIKNDNNTFESLSLAPLSVFPQHQNKGIGSVLLVESLKVAKEMGFESVILVGHEKYYPRFGFLPASKWGIKAPFEVPDANFMALELKAGSLENASGTIVFPKEFLL